MLGTAGNLKVKEQSKYKPVPIVFLFLVNEGKPRNMKFLIFWACDINRKSHLRRKVRQNLCPIVRDRQKFSSDM